MEYSGLVQAIVEKDSSKTDTLIKSLRPRLISFLRIRMNASEADAEDCAQEAVLICLNAIENGSLKNPERVFSYLMTTCKNLYLDMHKHNREYTFENPFHDHYHNPFQLTRLLDEEKNRILYWCFNKLKRKHREFMEYWFKLPGSQAKSVANHFGISESNVWTRKHRILTLLNKCYEKKSKL